MTAPTLSLPPPSARAAREVATLAFWRAARFGLEAALRNDPVVAADCCATLDQIARHGAPSLARRAAAARARIAAVMAAEAASPLSPVAFIAPVALQPPSAAAKADPSTELDGWLRFWLPWWPR